MMVHAGPTRTTMDPSHLRRDEWLVLNLYCSYIPLIALASFSVDRGLVYRGKRYTQLSGLATGTSRGAISLQESPHGSIATC